MKIELHIFTNCTKNAPKTDIIEKTYNSFVETFGKIDYKIWLDKNPEIDKLYNYEHNLNQRFGLINITKSLSDGYIQAIKGSKADYLFMLEHDWSFTTKTASIQHGLIDFMNIMYKNEIYHLRFNKRKNEPQKWDKTLEEKFLIEKKFWYCKTPVLSNNPHIINRVMYRDFIRKGFIKVLPGSHGIEEIISKQKHLSGAIYGPLGYPATVKHIDGRK